MKKNDRIILWRDEARIADMKQQLESLLPLADKMVMAYLALPFADPEINFSNLYSQTEAQAENHIRKNSPESLNVAGLTLNKNKFAQFLEVDGMLAFRDAKKAFEANNGEGMVSYFRLAGKSHINEETHVEINPEQFERFEARNTIEVGEQDRELYNAWKKMIDGLVGFDRYVKKEFTFLAGLTVPKLAVYLKEDKGGQIIPNPELFKIVAKTLRKNLS